MMINKADAGDFAGRFREVISDPLNLLIARVPNAGLVEGEDVILHNGNRVPLAGPYAYYGPFSSLLVLNRGVHEPLEEYVFQEVLRRLPEAPRMLELGAYWGHYSMWLKKARPQATVILVEPEAANIASGRHNFQRNGFEGEFIQAFVGKGQFEVDAFLASRGMPHLDILHVDIQGFEVEMLAGAQTTLQAAAADYVFISTHSQDIHYGIIRALGDLGDLGYRVETASDFENGTTSYDGFVFASSPRAARVFDDLAVLGRDRLVNSTPNELLDNLIAVRRAAQTA
jgi:hypothetical protein